MKKPITYIIYLLVSSWTVGAFLSAFYPADLRLEWTHIYMWTPAIFTLLWLIINRESIKTLKWGLKKPWWFYLIAIYIPFTYVIPEIAIQQWSGFVSYDFSSFEVFKELGIKIPFAALIGLGIPVLGEELGWRGYLQDKLVHELGEIKGILSLGLIWAAWHLPDIMQQEDWLFTALVFYPLFCISLSFVIYWAMKKCNSIWIAVFIHASNNYIWNAAYSSATINNENGANTISLIFFLLVAALITTTLIIKRKKAST